MPKVHPPALLLLAENTFSKRTLRDRGKKAQDINSQGLGR
jgi:hypothetical protein